MQQNLGCGDQLFHLFSDPVRPPIRVPITYAPPFWPFPNHKSNPAFIHSFQMVRSQESQPDPFDVVQQFTRSSRLSNTPSWAEDKRFDRPVGRRFGNQSLNRLERLAQFVQRDRENAFPDDPGVVRPDGELLADVTSFSEVN